MVISGEGQSAPAGESLPSPIVVQARLSSGEGFPGKVLSISVLSGGGKVVKTTDTTDARGNIIIQWQLGMEVGTQQLRITGDGLQALDIEATALRLPGSLALMAGDGQEGFPGDTLSTPIQISLKDDQGQPISGRKIEVRVPEGFGHILTFRGVTDENGDFKFLWIVGDHLGQQELTILAGTEANLQVKARVHPAPPDVEVTVFDEALIEYASGNQQILAEVHLPEVQYQNITAELELKSPCQNCQESNCDPWDRIGSITLDVQGSDGTIHTLELLKFITPFGNSNQYTEDLSAYGSQLRGAKTIRARITTFLGQWKVTLKIKFKKATLNPTVPWAFPLYYDFRIFSEESDTTMIFEVPENGLVELAYRPTGHNAQGRGCDEFCQKVHQIYLDGALVKELIPWRTDCAQGQPVNRCGSPGSVQASRAGWCPGDIVHPQLIKLGPLEPGQHSLRLRILNINPEGGYWNASLDVRGYR